MDHHDERATGPGDTDVLSALSGARAVLGPGAVAIVRERHRQIAEEGFSVLRDRELFGAELALASQAYVAAALYAQATGTALGLAPDSWPWPAELFKPSADPARNLEKAGALIAAELDRLHGDLPDVH